jgi:hypothetical protein
MRKIGRGAFQIGTVIALARHSQPAVMHWEYVQKGSILVFLRRKTAVAEKEMNKMLARLDRFDVCL